jgi:hypothetical protein
MLPQLRLLCVLLEKKKRKKRKVLQLLRKLISPNFFLYVINCSRNYE